MRDHYDVGQVETRAEQRREAEQPVSQLEVLKSAPPGQARAHVDQMSAQDLPRLRGEVDQLPAAERQQAADTLAGRLDGARLVKVEPAFGRPVMDHAVERHSSAEVKADYRRAQTAMSGVVDAAAAADFSKPAPAQPSTLADAVWANLPNLPRLLATGGTISSSLRAAEVFTLDPATADALRQRKLEQAAGAATDARSEDIRAQWRAEIGQARLVDARGERAEAGSLWRMEANLERAGTAPADPSAAATGPSAAADPSAPLTQADLDRLGSALPPTGGRQNLWTSDNPAVVSGIAGRALEQGLITDATLDRNGALANQAIPTEKRSLDAGELLAMAKQAGIPLERLDPGQLAQATNFINRATDAQNQRDRINWSLTNLGLAAENKGPQLTRTEMIEFLWAAARVPGHALNKLSDTQLAAKYQEIACATNTEGQSSVKISGDHTLNLTVGKDGAIQDTKTKHTGGFWNGVVNLAKKAAPIALGFIGGPVGMAIKVGLAVKNSIDAIKKGDWFGAITGALSGVVSGAKVFGNQALERILTNTGRALNGAKGVFDGISQRSITAGLTGLVNLADAGSELLRNGADKVEGLAKNFADAARYARIGRSGVGAIDAAQRGDVTGAVNQAYATYQAVRNDGNPAADGKQGATTQQPQSDLDRILGYANTAATVTASVRSRNYLGAAAAASDFANTQVSGPKDQARLQDLSTALRGTDTLQRAIRGNDYLAAAAAGADIAAAFTRNGSDTREDLAAGGRVLRSADRLRDAIGSGNLQASVDAGQSLYETVDQEIDQFRQRRMPELPIPESPLDLLGLERYPFGSVQSPGLPPLPINPSDPLDGLSLVREVPPSQAELLRQSGDPYFETTSYVEVSASDPASPRNAEQLRQSGDPYFETTSYVEVSASDPASPRDAEQLRQGGDPYFETTSYVEVSASDPISPETRLSLGLSPEAEAEARQRKRLDEARQLVGEARTYVSDLAKIGSLPTSRRQLSGLIEDLKEQIDLADTALRDGRLPREAKLSAAMEALRKAMDEVIQIRTTQAEDTAAFDRAYDDVADFAYAANPALGLLLKAVKAERDLLIRGEVGGFVEVLLLPLTAPLRRLIGREGAAKVVEVVSENISEQLGELAIKAERGKLTGADVDRAIDRVVFDSYSELLPYFTLTRKLKAAEELKGLIEELVKKVFGDVNPFIQPSPSPQPRP